ncbi:hypothetical protein G5T42_10360 [Microbacterium sp. 4R-513]|uniref:hypothetical protein n=1 Tax=Microbacterium sp. 4R-513 TaxID=2567934 RepID=UPI0013E120A9|nr:hypothetical protein [Microbacterium sp. 4R-513]QIG39836.1 hypothetical protein G5T42_10360 [Microbacterium sp. 4R-513]
MRRLQRNRYVLQSLWDQLWPESRHLLEVVAVHSEMREGGGVQSYVSAGAAHGLPLYRCTPARVHATFPPTARSTSRPGLFRHCEPLPEEDVEVRDGIPCTTLARTTSDVVRVVGRDTAVAFADAALRRVSVVGRRYDSAAAEQWRAGMLERIARARGARGIRQAEEVIRFADGRAELPGESVTRLQLARLGWTRFELQVPIAAPGGGEYFVDLEIEDARTFVEFDGQGKYLDESMRSGRSLDQVVLDEKRREDWIRGVTQKRLVRVEGPHIETTEALAARLAGFGILLPSE